MLTERQINLHEIKELYDDAVAIIDKLPAFTKQEHYAKGTARSAVWKLRKKGEELAQQVENLQKLE